MHQALNAAGVEHRYCTGSGDHSWTYWLPDLRDFLATTYGSTPSTCTTNPGWTLQP